MSQASVEDLLRRLNSPESQEAWREFLELYAALIYQVIRHFDTDPDRAGDCFQFVCERLVEHQCKKLRTFKFEGTATFPTWLRAVTRNLCIDWHRKEFGRHRPFRSISRLSPFDQEVFRLVYERGIPIDETQTILVSGFQNVTEARLLQSKERIDRLLTRNQRWLLSQRSAKTIVIERSEVEEPTETLSDVTDPGPDPEAQTYSKERRKKLERSLATLETEDQLLIRMRFEQELTLDQVARLLGLGNAQRADRRLKEILGRLRKQMDQT